jgi:hypothetical protein
MMVFIFGLFVGGFLGCLLMALAVAAEDDRDQR